MNVWSAHMPVHHMHAMPKEPAERSYTLELQLQMVVSCCVGAGNVTQILSGQWYRPPHRDVSGCRGASELSESHGYTSLLEWVIPVD